MLEFNGKLFLDISFPELPDVKVTSKSFRKLTIVQESDNKVPIAELNLVTLGYDLIEQFDKDGIIMEVSYSTIREKATESKYKFLMTNLRFEETEDNQISVSLFFSPFPHGTGSLSVSK